MLSPVSFKVWREVNSLPSTSKEFIRNRRFSSFYVLRERVPGFKFSRAKFVGHICGISTSRLSLILLNLKTKKEVIIEIVDQSREACFRCLLLVHLLKTLFLSTKTSFFYGILPILSLESLLLFTKTLVDVFYPKSLDLPFDQQLRHKPRPILLRYHGGGLAGGSSLYPPFFSPWYLELAKENLAIIVFPNYRPLLESSVMDILEDAEDHWQWTHRDMPLFLEQETAGALQADLSRIMSVGESAGGYLSLQMGLNHASKICAVNAVYPVVDFKTPRFCNGQQKPVFNMSPFPRNYLERHMEEVKRQEALT